MAATLPAVKLDELANRASAPARRPFADRAPHAADVSGASPAVHVAPGAPAAPDLRVADEAAARALAAIRGIVRALHINTRAMELRTGLSLAQIFVLQELARSPVHALNDLAARTATHQSSVSVVVRRLADRGMVTRTASEGDHRRVEIAITEAGRELLANAPATVQGRLIGALAQMDDDRRQSLAELLEQWLSRSQIDLAAPAMFGEQDAEH